MRRIRGGVAAPAGFVCGAVACGVKNPKASRDDVVLVASERPCVAAATFTTNVIKAAPVLVSMEHLRSGQPRAVVLNSGNANACTGERGVRDARMMAASAGQRLGIPSRDVLVCSTGRIGVPLPVERITAGIERLVLSRTANRACAQAIMTSDTFPKECAFSFTSSPGTFRLAGMAKGAGMIDPRMATMLCVITTDARVSGAVLRKALRAAVEVSFNRITVDGDMSTNDCVIALANGASGVTPEPREIEGALSAVCQKLAGWIVEDGEGVSRFVEVEVRGAASTADARRAAEAVANSTLVKCAWAGGDPNWGRIMDAIGYSGAKIHENRIAIDYDKLPIVRGGLAASTPWRKLRGVAGRKRFRIAIDLGIGKGSFVVWTTDLTEEYVRLNLGE